MDWFWINKLNQPDPIRLQHRVLMILATAFILLYWEHHVYKSILLSCIPYPLFDPALNLIRGKKWDAPASSKAWDRWIGRFNSYFVLVVRFIVVGVLTYLYIKL